MTLRDLARADAATAAPDTPIADVTAAMRDGDLDLVVVLEEGRPLGLVSAADVGRAVVAGEDLAGRTAGDLLTGDPVTVPADADRAALLAAFEASGERRAIVVDDGEFVGVASLGDALVAYGRELETILALFGGA